MQRRLKTRGSLAREGKGAAMPSLWRSRRQTALLAAATVILALSVTGEAMAAGYVFWDADRLEVRSTNGRAKAKGSIKWFHGRFPYGYRHRGDYSRGAKVYATRPVGCIWARVSYGFPTGGFTVGPGGPSGSISNGEYRGRGYFVNCRRKGRRRPTRLSLYGVGYAKALLNSSTLEVCTSRSRRQGPRFCAFEKNTY